MVAPSCARGGCARWGACAGRETGISNTNSALTAAVRHMRCGLNDFGIMDYPWMNRFRTVHALRPARASFVWFLVGAVLRNLRRRTRDWSVRSGLRVA